MITTSSICGRSWKTQCDVRGRRKLIFSHLLVFHVLKINQSILCKVTEYKNGTIIIQLAQLISKILMQLKFRNLGSRFQNTLEIIGHFSQVALKLKYIKFQILRAKRSDTKFVTAAKRSSIYKLKCAWWAYLKCADDRICVRLFVFTSKTPLATTDLQ